MKSQSNRKFRDIDREMRRRIITGDYPAGSRLPTWDQLEKEFNVSRATLPRAIERLKRDGFLVPKGKRGTFVAESPPTKRRFGLVYVLGVDGAISHSVRTFLDLIPAVSRELDIEIVPYALDHQDSSEGEINKLKDDLTNYRIGGIFALWAVDFEIIELAHAQGMRVAVAWSNPQQRSSSNQKKYQDVDVLLRMNFPSFHEKVADWLINQGCRRVAAIGNTTRQVEMLRESLEQRNVPTLSPYFLAVGGQFKQAENIVRLLGRLPAKERPDSLVVTDDYLIEHVVSGLVAENISVPGDMTIVSYESFPFKHHLALPVKRAGYHIPTIFTETMAALSTPSTFRAPKVIEAPIHFDHELPQTVESEEIVTMI